MLYLSDSAVRYAINKCKQQNNYRVGIATICHSDIKDVFGKFCKLVDGQYSKICNSQYIMFESGSVIKFFCNHRRYKRFHF